MSQTVVCQVYNVIESIAVWLEVYFFVAISGHINFHWHNCNFTCIVFKWIGVKKCDHTHESTSNQFWINRLFQYSTTAKIIILFFLRQQWVTNWDIWKECIDIKESMVEREQNTNPIYSHLFIWEDMLELKFITCLRASGKNLWNLWNPNKCWFLGRERHVGNL